MVNAGPSISGRSTIESKETLITAGKLSQAVFQSRDTYGKILNNANDNFEMSFVGPTPQTTGSFSLTAVYQNKGLYIA
jgi:hypothetical protein